MLCKKSWRSDYDRCLSAETDEQMFCFLFWKRVESFLHKDVSFVVTGNQEYLKDQKCADTKAGVKETSEAQRPIMTRDSVVSSDKRRPGTPRPMVLRITHTFSKTFYFLQRICIVDSFMCIFNVYEKLWKCTDKCTFITNSIFHYLSGCYCKL